MNKSVNTIESAARVGITPKLRLRGLLAASAIALGQLMLGSGAVFAQDAAVAPVEQMQAAGVNINTATAAELSAALSGVGGSKAEAIIRYREQFGAFESVEELTEVKGIGTATLERNRGMIRVK